MNKEQLETEINLIDYAIYYNQPNNYLKQILLQKKENLEGYLQNIEKFPPLMTFVGNYSYDYKLSSSFQSKLNWKNDLKLWKLEFSQPVANLMNNLQSYYQQLSGQNNKKDLLKSFQKKQTISRWKNDEIKKQEIQNVIIFNQSLQTQYQNIRETINKSKKQKSVFKKTFFKTQENNINKADLNNHFNSKQEISFSQSQDNLRQDQNQIIEQEIVKKQVIMQQDIYFMDKQEECRLNLVSKIELQNEEFQQIPSSNNSHNENESKFLKTQIFLDQKIDKEISICVEEIKKYSKEQNENQDIQSLDGKINIFPFSQSYFLKQ